MEHQPASPQSPTSASPTPGATPASGASTQAAGSDDFFIEAGGEDLLNPTVAPPAEWGAPTQPLDIDALPPELEAGGLDIALDQPHAALPAAPLAAPPAAPIPTVVEAPPVHNPEDYPPMQAPGSVLPPGYRLQEFELRATLGQGGFSVVYRAWDHALRREVALKEYMPASMAARRMDQQVVPKSDAHREIFLMGLRSFIEEGVTLAKFDHPALVRVYRNFEAHGTAYMVMQLVEGETLESVAQRLKKPVDEAWLLDLLDPLTTALHVVHSARIVHRDIAPDNIMLLKGTQQPLLLDFGAARQVIGDNHQHPTAILKPSYAPIEQYPESGIVQGAHTDIYALAGVIHRLLTGNAPPNAQTRMLRDNYQPLSQRLAGRYSPGLLRAVDHALAVQPGQRPADIPGFRKEIGLDERSRRGPALVAAPAPAAAGRSGLVWGGAAAVLALGAAGFFLLGGDNADKPASVSATGASPGAATTAPGSQAAPVAAAPLAPVSLKPGQKVDPAVDFERIVQGTSPGHRVSLTVEQASLKAQQTPLRLRLSSEQPGYFYVLVHDTDGEVRQLFPSAGQPNTRIQAGQSLNLPASVVDPVSKLERVDQLLFSEPLGPAKLLAVVSSVPLDLTPVVQALEGDYRLLVKQVPDGRPDASRPLFLGSPMCPAGPGACESSYGAATANFQVVR